MVWSVEMATRAERRNYGHRPNYYRERFLREYILRGPRRGWMGMGIHRERSGDPNADNPAISMLMLLAFLSFCFVVSVAALVILRFIR